MRNAVRLTVVLTSAALLSGCGGFFDDLANYQAPVEPYQPASGTDYVAACHAYGCPSNAPTNSPGPQTPVQSGCKTSLPDGTFPTGGTACPQ